MQSLHGRLGPGAYDACSRLSRHYIYLCTTVTPTAGHLCSHARLVCIVRGAKTVRLGQSIPSRSQPGLHSQPVFLRVGVVGACAPERWTAGRPLGVGAHHGGYPYWLDVLRAVSASAKLRERTIDEAGHPGFCGPMCHSGTLVRGWELLYLTLRGTSAIAKNPM